MSRATWINDACATDYGPSFDSQPVAVQIATCTQCPVREACLAHALAHETPGNKNLAKRQSVWGGTTARQRRALRRAAA